MSLKKIEKNNPFSWLLMAEGHFKFIVAQLLDNQKKKERKERNSRHMLMQFIFSLSILSFLLANGHILDEWAGDISNDIFILFYFVCECACEWVSNESTICRIEYRMIISMNFFLLAMIHIRYACCTRDSCCDSVQWSNELNGVS